jgi:hypothetical protein
MRLRKLLFVSQNVPTTQSAQLTAKSSNAVGEQYELATETAKKKPRT